VYVRFIFMPSSHGAHHDHDRGCLTHTHKGHSHTAQGAARSEISSCCCLESSRRARGCLRVLGRLVRAALAAGPAPRTQTPAALQQVQVPTSSGARPRSRRRPLPRYGAYWPAQQEV
jgi:hypothetical protein